MKGFCLFIFHAFLALSLARTDLPKIPEDNACKLAMLLAIREAIPTLFEEGAEYDVDMFEFLELNRTLVTYLESNDEFKRLNTDRKRINVHIKVEDAPEEEKEKNKPSLSKSFQDRVLKQVSTFEEDDKEKDVHDVFKEVFPKIISLSDKLDQRHSQGILLALATSLDDPTKKDVLKEKDPRAIFEKIQSLLHVDFHKFKKHFRFETFGLNPSDFTRWEHIFSLVDQTLNEEEELLAHFIYVLYNRRFELEALKYRKSINEFRDLLEKLPQKIEESIQKTEKYFEWKTADQKLLEKQLNNILRVSPKEQKKKLDREANPENPALEFTLVEVPALLAAFRGLVGGDCASQYCFGFTYLPGERTFFLYNNWNEAIGYAVLTETMAHDGKSRKPAWYLHDITGNRLPVKSAKIILQAFAKLAEEEGSVLLLPTTAKIHANNNHMPLIRLQQGMIRNAPAYRLMHQDSTLRNHLNQSGVELNMEYDTTPHNTTAHAPNFSEEELENIHVEIQRPTLFDFDAKPAALNQGEATLLILDLLTSQRMESSKVALAEAVAEIQAAGLNVNKIDYSARIQAAQVIADLGSVNLPSISQLDALLINSYGMPLEKYYAMLEVHFQTLGVSNFKQILEERAYYFYEGHLSAEDALTTDHKEWQRMSKDFVVKLLKRWPNPQIAFEVLKKYPQAFDDYQKFHNLIRSFMARPEGVVKKLRRIEQTGVSLDFLTPEEKANLARLRE